MQGPGTTSDIHGILPGAEGSTDSVRSVSHTYMHAMSNSTPQLQY
jgi:hypothetical protein